MKIALMNVQRQHETHASEYEEAALKVLKGEKLDNSLLSTILSGAGGGLLDGAMDLLGLGKK